MSSGNSPHAAIAALVQLADDIRRIRAETAGEGSRRAGVAQLLDNIESGLFTTIVHLEIQAPAAAVAWKQHLSRLRDEARECAVWDNDSWFASLKGFCMTLASGLRQVGELLPPDDASWTKPDSLSQWAKRFGVSLATMKKWFLEGKIRNQKLSAKSYRVDVRDLPASPAG